MARWFTRFSTSVANLAGHYVTFAAAVVLIIMWAISGPFFRFSSTWQLVINTGTTIITFLMVFVIQNTQNRDSKAIHVKLDEIVRTLNESDDSVLNAEDESDETLESLKRRYEALAQKPQ